jgi:predicted esterase
MLRPTPHLLLLFLLASSIPLAAAQPLQNDSLYFGLGHVTERVVAGTDPSRHYAVYLPSTLKRGRLYPVLFLMDPRGRAMMPLPLFLKTAERLGYVLISSYETLSDADSAFAVNDRSLTAMLIDAQTRFSADPKRLYLAGFSGTAHYSWTVASQLDGNLAGMFVAGDGLQMADEAVKRTTQMSHPPAVFATAGTGDFNYDGARGKDLGLDATGLPHRFVAFDGEHSWPPEHVAAFGLSWLHLRAMRSGMGPVDPAFVDSLFTVDLETTRNLERTGRVADAARRYRELLADYDGLLDLAEVRRQAGILTVSSRLRRQMAEREQLARRVTLYKLDLAAIAESYRDAPDPPDHENTLRRLQIALLADQMINEANTDVAAAARRMLAAAHVRFSFYEARRYFELKDYARAAAVLRIARAIRPHAPLDCLRLARAEAQLGNTDSAIEALTCAVNGGVLSPGQLGRDSLLDPVREDPRFGELQERVRRQASPS